MNISLIPVFYALVAIASLWLALLWGARVKRSRDTRVFKVLIGVVTVWLLVVPFGGLPLWSRAFSFYPNPSIPLLGIVCAALYQRLLGISVFKPSDWTTLWVFGALGGTILYLHPAIFSGIDLYFWGWHRDSAVWGLAGGAIVLLACGSRLGVLVLAALIAYAVNALESQNCWDYLMDPFFWLISLVVLGKRMFMRLFRTAGKRFSGRVSNVGVDVSPERDALAETNSTR